MKMMILIKYQKIKMKIVVKTVKKVKLNILLKDKLAFSLLDTSKFILLSNFNQFIINLVFENFTMFKITLCLHKVLNWCTSTY